MASSALVRRISAFFRLDLSLKKSEKGKMVLTVMFGCHYTV